jgi:hypothetical protein
MRSPENERLVLAMWAEYEREGLPAILRRSDENARWRPFSGGGRIFRTSAMYRHELDSAMAEGVRLRTWSQYDTVVVRGQIETLIGDDTFLYWLHRIRAKKISWTSSSPDLDLLFLDGELDLELVSLAHAELHDAD